MTPEETDQLIRQQIPVETADSIRRIVPLEPNSPPPQPSDSSRNPNDAQRPPRAKYDPPYIMGSTTTGSGWFTADPFTWGDSSRAAQLGPWGGDAPPASPLTIRIDTWHRDRPPRDAAGRRTWGVKCDLIRIYEEPQGTTPETYVTYIFERQAVFDAEGTPVYITGEEWVNSGEVTERTLLEPPNRHPFEGYWTKLTYKTDALDIYIAHGTVCRGDEKFVGTAITAGDGTLASVFTLTSALPLIYIKCIFDNDGSIYACTFEQEASAKAICYEYDSGTSRHTWWHPILRYHAIDPDFNSKHYPAVDSGMERPIGGMAGWTILQLTNTNLVGQQQCMTDGASPPVTRTAWKLVPGPGATTGAGA